MSAQDSPTTEERFSQAMELLRSVPDALSRLLDEEIEFKHRAAPDNEWEPIGVAGWNVYRFRPAIKDSLTAQEEAKP